MTDPNLLGTYVELRAQLAAAYSATHWSSDVVDRIADDLAVVEFELAKCQPVDEQTSDPLPGN